MNLSRFSRYLAGAVASALLAAPLATAQLSVEQVNATNKLLQQIKAGINKLPPSHQQMLDGYANIGHLADVWATYGMRLTDPTFIAHGRQARAARFAAGTPGASIVPVSDPSTDVAYSAFAGFTQSETSTARCGNTVVVGYNDSGSVFETPFFYTGTGGQAFSGASYSTDGGLSFTDIGPMNPGPNDGNFLGGDPGLNCSDPNTFYYSQIFDYSDASGNPWAAVSVNISNDGGKTWGDPIAAVSKNAFDHFIDKPWSAIDPSNHKRILVSYTDFDFSKTNACGTNFPNRTAIEFVQSLDGGKTWSKPFVAYNACGAAGVQGSQIALDSRGTFYISWLNLGSDFPFSRRTIQIASAIRGTGHLSAPVTVERAVQPGGDSYFLQGEFRDFLDMSMAVDHSGTASEGAIYITWADGRDKEVTDPLALQGFYAYDDVFFRASFDGGKTWGGRKKVNSDSQPAHGSGHDHYQSGVAVDRSGNVGVCWYDRRADNENFAIRRHCGESNNGGASFSDSDIGMPGFAPTHGIDLFINPIYMGDYDQLTSDFLNYNSGFVGAFQNQMNRGNPDVDAHSMK
jgi:hypothetical protein